MICGFRNTRCVNFKMGQRNELRVAVSAPSCPMPTTPRRSTQPALWPLCPREGEAPAEPQTQPTAEHLSEAPAACQPTTEPCPQLIAIRNHPAKQLRRSPSTGSGSSPAIRGLSGIWAHRPTASSQSPRGRGVGGGLHSESPGIGAEPARGPEPVGTSLREADTSKKRPVSG